MLYHPNRNAYFEMHTDASKLACGAMLGQNFPGKLRPVKYASKSFSPTESCWPTTHRELSAVKWGIEQSRPYILGHRLKVVTDHANLKCLHFPLNKQNWLDGACQGQNMTFKLNIDQEKNLLYLILSVEPLCRVHLMKSKLLLCLQRKSLLFSLLPWVSIYQHIHPH